MCGRGNNTSININNTDCCVCSAASVPVAVVFSGTRFRWGWVTDWLTKNGDRVLFCLWDLSWTSCPHSGRHSAIVRSCVTNVSGPHTDGVETQCSWWRRCSELLHRTCTVSKNATFDLGDYLSYQWCLVEWGFVSFGSRAFVD